MFITDLGQDARTCFLLLKVCFHLLKMENFKPIPQPPAPVRLVLGGIWTRQPCQKIC
jgi:hypothetical protein